MPVGSPVQTLEGGTMPVSVWTSTLKRTIQTAELLPFPKLRWKVRARPSCPCRQQFIPRSQQAVS